MQEYNVEHLAGQPWEETLEVLTADMDPERIDVSLLAERYREYINELQEFDLSVPAQAIRLCAALVRFKALALDDEHLEEQEPEQENPMDFEEEEIEEEEELNLTTGPELEMPVKPRPKRRMQLDELKDALADAMEVKERREERQEHRQELDEQFEFEEEDLNSRIDSLFSKLKGLVSTPSEKVKFDSLLDENTSEEKIEKFMHVLHLETDQKVQCHQEEFLGDLHVKPEEDEVAN